MTEAEGHSTHLQELGIPAVAVPALVQYLDLVQEWNKRTNLTAAHGPEERVRVLVADAWRAAPVVRPGSLIDVGSGNGSPGLVLGLLRPDLHVTLLEPRARRWAFLREVARRVNREDIEVARCRAEEFDGEARTVTLRAVGLSLEAVAPLVEPGGDVLIFGGQPEEAPPFVRLGCHPLEHSELHVFRRLVPPNVSRET